MTYIFLDTNIFLHYKPIEQINWLEVVGSDKVTIIIARVVIRELDKIKDNHPRVAIRNRARTVLRRIEAVQIDNSSLDLHKGVDLLFVDEPSIDFPETGLFRDIPDDHLIASILAFLEINPDAQAVLIAHDTGLRIKTRARGIDSNELPEQYRLPDSSDESEREIRQLRRQVEQLKHQFPILVLSFANGKDHYKVSLEAPFNPAEDDIAQRLVELKGQYPQISPPPPRQELQSKNTLLSFSTKLSETLSGLVQPGPEAFAHYNEQLDAFYEGYEYYLRNYTEGINLQRRTIRLDIKLSNRGTAPAEDIDVFMHFQDSFILYEEHEQPEMPEEPIPPHDPRSRTMSDIMNFGLKIRHPSSGDYSRVISSPSNVSSLEIRRSNSYKVSFEVGKLKQHKDETPGPMFLVFDSFETASSFGIEYRINAANLPEEIEGMLHVVVEKDSIVED